MYHFLILIHLKLDVNNGTTLNVQQKSEARYIVERSLHNTVSHVMSVAVSYYMLGQQCLEYIGYGLLSSAKSRRLLHWLFWMVVLLIIIFWSSVMKGKYCYQMLQTFKQLILQMQLKIWMAIMSLLIKKGLQINLSHIKGHQEDWGYTFTMDKAKLFWTW